MARGKRLAGWRDLADHAHAQGFGRAEHPPGHDQQHCALPADEPGELLRAATARQDPDFHFGQAKLCPLACDNNVGTQSEFEASAERKSFDRRDHRLGAVHDRAPVFLHVARHDLDRACLRHFADIGAGGKSNVRSRHDDATHFVVGAAAGDLVGQSHAHLEIERIAHLRPIDPEDDDVLSRVLNEEGVRGGHEIGPVELGE